MSWKPQVKRTYSGLYFSCLKPLGTMFATNGAPGIATRTEQGTLRTGLQRPNKRTEHSYYVCNKIFFARVETPCVRCAQVMLAHHVAPDSSVPGRRGHLRPDRGHLRGGVSTPCRLEEHSDRSASEVLVSCSSWEKGLRAPCAEYVFVGL